MVQGQMGFIVLWSLGWVTWVGLSSSPAGLGSEWHLAVSTSCRLSEVTAEPAKEATQWAVSAGPPLPPAPRGPRQASQPALGCRALPRETRRESWLIMSSLTSQLSRGPSFYQTSQGPNAGQGLMDVRNWLLAVAPACPPGVPETSLSPGAHSQSPCLYCITPALVAPHCLARGCLGQIENYPDHSDPRAGRRFLRWDTGPRQWKCESSHSENAYTVWARIDTSRN